MSCAKFHGDCYIRIWQQNKISIIEFTIEISLVKWSQSVISIEGCHLAVKNLIVDIRWFGECGSNITFMVSHVMAIIGEQNLMQKRRISSVLAIELHVIFIKPPFVSGLWPIHAQTNKENSPHQSLQNIFHEMPATILHCENLFNVWYIPHQFPDSSDPMYYQPELNTAYGISILTVRVWHPKLAYQMGFQGTMARVYLLTLKKKSIMFLQSTSNFFFFSVNSLWPSDTIWRLRSGSTLIQVMGCCLTAPSHYLHQCWLIISKAQYKENCTRDTSVIRH